MWEDLDKMELMDDDCLHFIRMLFIDMYLHKYTKMCTCIILFFHVPLWSTQFYQYLKTFDALLLIQYGPLSLIFVFAFISMIGPIIYEKNINEYFATTEKIFWSLSACSKELKAIILKKAKYFVYITKINIIICASAFFFLFMRARTGRKWELIYQITYLKENFPDQSNILIVIFYITMLYFLIPMLSMVYVLSYTVLHICFQADMVNERISKIPENFENNIELVYDEIYQKQVFERFRFCVARLTKLKSYSEIMIGQGATFVVVNITLAMLLVVCSVGMWYLDQDKYYPALIAFILTASYSGLVAVEIGQLVEYKSMVSYHLLADLPWYTFSAKNQKLLLFTLIHASTPLKISKFASFPVNRVLIVQLYKLCSTLSAFLANTKKNIFT